MCLSNKHCLILLRRLVATGFEMGATYVCQFLQRHFRSSCIASGVSRARPHRTHNAWDSSFARARVVVRPLGIKTGIAYVIVVNFPLPPCLSSHLLGFTHASKDTSATTARHILAAVVPTRSIALGTVALVHHRTIVHHALAHPTQRVKAGSIA